MALERCFNLVRRCHKTGHPRNASFRGAPKDSDPGTTLRTNRNFKNTEVARGHASRTTADDETGAAVPFFGLLRTLESFRMER
jgi:hypothetical protein